MTQKKRYRKPKKKTLLLNENISPSKRLILSTNSLGNDLK